MKTPRQQPSEAALLGKLEQCVLRRLYEDPVTLVCRRSPNLVYASPLHSVKIIAIHRADDSNIIFDFIEARSAVDYFASVKASDGAALRLRCHLGQVATARLLGAQSLIPVTRGLYERFSA